MASSASSVAQNVQTTATVKQTSYVPQTVTGQRQKYNREDFPFLTDAQFDAYVSGITEEYTYTTYKPVVSYKQVTLSDGTILGNVEQAQAKIDEMGKEYSEIRSLINDISEQITEVEEKAKKDQEEQVKALTERAIQQYQQENANKNGKDIKDFNTYLANFIKSGLVDKYSAEIKGLVAQRDGLAKQSITIAKDLELANNILNQMRTECGATAQQPVMGAVNATEGQTSQSDALNLVINNGTEQTVQGMSFLSLTAKAEPPVQTQNVEQETAQKVEDNKKNDALTTEEAKVDAKVENEGKTKEEATQEIKEEKKEEAAK